MNKQSRYSRELREGAVRKLLEQRSEYESQWAAMKPVEAEVGCTVETLRQSEKDLGLRNGVTSDERERLKQLEGENRELKRASEILRKASAYFAQAELDRQPK